MDKKLCGLETKIGIKEKRYALVCLLTPPVLKKSCEVTATLQQVVWQINRDGIGNDIAGKIYKAIVYLSAQYDYKIKGNKIRYSELLGSATFAKIYNLLKDNVSSVDAISIYDLLDKIRKEGAKKCKDIDADGFIEQSEKREIMDYYEGLGLADYIKADGEIIYSYENIEQAKQIVEGYFGREEISIDERRAVLMCILGNPLLRTNNVRGTCNLSTLVNKLKLHMGLEDRKIFAIVIILGIEGEIFNYSYGMALLKANNLIERLKGCKDSKMPTEIEGDVLRKAVEKSQNKENEVNVCEYYRKLGADFIYDSYGKLCYSESDLSMARQITEGYFRGEEITDVEKKAVLRSLLNREQLKLKGNVVFDKLLIIVNRMREKGVVDRNIYGFLINLSSGNKISDIVFSYNGVLRDPQKLDDILKYNYSTKVTPGILQKICKDNGSRERRISGLEIARSMLEILDRTDSTEICDAVAKETSALAKRK